jgi:hypothetical protein
MAKLHHLNPEKGVHGFVSRDLAPALSIDSGDRVVFQTLDSGWGAVEQIRNFSRPREFRPRDLNRDVAHALTGPLEIRGARPGMVLEIHLRRIRPGHLGMVCQFRVAGAARSMARTNKRSCGPSCVDPGVARGRGDLLGTPAGPPYWNQPLRLSLAPEAVHGNHGNAS